MHHKIVKVIKGSFFAGTIIIIPVATSIFIMYKLFVFLDNIVPSIIQVHLPIGTGLIGIVLFILLVGLVAKNYFGKWCIKLGLALIANIPLLNKLYLTLEQIMQLIANPKKNFLGKPVMVEYPRQGSYCIGYITTYETEEISHCIGHKVVCVYVPTTPNPTSGFMLYVPESDTIDLNMSPEIVFKAIVSAGIISSTKTNVMDNKYSLPDLFYWLKKQGKSARSFDPRD